MCMNILKVKDSGREHASIQWSLEFQTCNLEVGLTKLAAVLTVTKSSSRPLK